jgi:hypothetical protein
MSEDVKAVIVRSDWIFGGLLQSTGGAGKYFAKVFPAAHA